MSTSIHAVAAPLWNQLLPGVINVLDKAEAYCNETGTAPSELLEARLAPDMFDFTTQVRMAATHSARAIEAVLTGEIVLGGPPQPATFASLRETIQDALAKVKAADGAAIDARADADVAVRIRDNALPFVAERYLLSFALPNFVFHVTTAYAIMRMKGVPVGKADYLGPVPLKQG